MFVSAAINAINLIKPTIIVRAVQKDILSIKIVRVHGDARTVENI